MAKLKMDNESIAESFFSDTRLLGIVAPMKDYLFTWNVNHHLGYNFRLNNNMEIQLIKKNRSYFFPMYEYIVPASALSHFIYNNQCDGEYLLPEFKHLDFLWLLKYDLVKDEELNHLVQMIKKIPGVQLVTEMINEKIKHKEHLIF